MATASTQDIHTADVIRILHVTDPHLFADPAGSLRGTVTHDSLKGVLEHIKQQDWTADLVALTGDLIQDDSAAAYVHCRELVGSLGLPVHCVPGNHDVRALMQESMSAAPFHYCSTLRLGNWSLIGVDSCREGQAGGMIAAAELDRVRAELAATDADHVLVCLHHPPLAVGSRWLDGVGLENGAEFLAMIAASGRVRAVLFGHVHQAFDNVYEEMRIVGTPSTCAQFKPHSDDFALDDRPPAYRRVSLLEDGSVDSELIWVSKP